jgi:uncharacterized membrane protein
MMKQKQTIPMKGRQNGRPATKSVEAGGDEKRPYTDEQGLERIVFFSDAVFAIAITLLALEIRLPPLPETATNAQLLAELGALWPRYLSYFISFMAIGMMWIVHHRTFRYLCRYDERLMFLNLLFLLLIGFLPFPTAVIGEFGNAVGTVFYAAAMSAAGLMFALLWWSANSRGRLVERPLPRPKFRLMWFRVLWMPLVFLFSIPLAFWSPDVAKFSWLLIVGTALWRQ